MLDSVKVSGVYLAGGDTALGMLMNIGADGSEILAEILVGVPLVRVKGGAMRDLTGNKGRGFRHRGCGGLCHEKNKRKRRNITHERIFTALWKGNTESGN